MSCNQDAAEDGTQSETAICLPPPLPLPLPPCRAGEGQCQALLHPLTMVQRGPARSGSRGAPSPALLESLWARGAGALPKHILTECLQTGCPGRAFNCTCFFILSFFFLIFFTKKKDFIQAIYIWISIITRRDTV
ncbi:hypothetical protein HJG60_007805 [Phyllostomus discolor]|uniref:Uncharacterized protein n=1 Tax=Phyllostomus discolor TaxID=89673 RepID=A0A834BN83_9CHIR|nr:hypothetical protein HJG60_007805 [Phyllostomus discolor]